MGSKLVNPTGKFIDYILNSWHYLNDPKHMLNYHLDCMYRQGIVEGKQKAIEFVEWYCKNYNVPEPHKTAVEFVEWRYSITLKQFDEINVNTFIDNFPPHVLSIDKKVNDWTEAHTEYYPAIYGGGVKSVGSYPFKFN
jgi:hypothetical protein